MFSILQTTLLAASLAFGQGQPGAPGEIAVGQFGGLYDADSPDIIPQYNAQSALNVEANLRGTAILKRQGYSLWASLGVSTAIVTGSTFFRDNSGNEIVIVCYNVYCAASKNGGAFTNIVTTATVTTTRWSFVNALGAVYGANDSRDAVFKYDGTTLSYPANIPAGSILELTRDRLVVADTSANPGNANYSKSGDFTTFAAGVNPTDPWADTIQVSGDKITGLKYDRGTLYIWKFKSLTACDVSDQFTTRCVPINTQIGTQDPNSITATPDGLYFVGSDNNIWLLANRNVVRVSPQIPNFLKSRAAGLTANNTQNTQAAWQAGTQTPGSSWNTTTISGSIFPSSITFNDQTTAQFSSGTFTRISTNVANTIALVQSGQAKFINAGAETDASTNWTFSGCSGIVRTTSFSPPYGSYVWEPQSQFCPMTVTANITDTSGNVLLTKVFTGIGPSFTSWTSYTFQTGSIAANAIKLTFSDGACTATSAPFIRGTSIIVAVAGTGNGGGLCEALWDVDESPVFVTTATFTSQTFNTAFSTPTWGPFSMAISSDANSNMVFYTQVATSSFGTWDGLVSASSGTKIASAAKQYIRYVSSFTVNSATNTTDAVTLVTLPAATTGQFVSQCITTVGATAWGNLSCSQSLVGNGSLTYYAGSASSCAGLPASPSTAQTNNAAFAATVNNYATFRFDSVLGSATDQAQINSCTLYWNKGNLSPPASGVYDSVRNAIFWTYSISNSSTTNRWLKYDLNIREWFPFDIVGNVPLIADNIIYFGSGQGTGQWFQYGGVNNDNGLAINSYWTSKDFYGYDPFVERSWDALSSIFRNQGSGNLTVKYTNGRQQVNSYTVSLSTTSGIPYIRSNYSAIKMTGSTFMTLQFGNNAADQPWELDGFGLYYTDYPWRVYNP